MIYNGTNNFLKWYLSNSCDVDTEDTRTPIVYFETDDPPVNKRAEALDEIFMNVAITPSQQYYGQIVVSHNNKGYSSADRIGTLKGAAKAATKFQ